MKNYSREYESPLAKSIKLLWGAQGRRISGDALALWERKLKPYEGATLFAVLEEEATSDRHPNLGRIMAAIVQKRQQPNTYRPPTLTDAQRTKAEHAAVMSMLWLELEHADMSSAATGIMRAVFARQFGADARGVVEQARKTYTPEQVREWFFDAEYRAKAEVRA